MVNRAFFSFFFSVRFGKVDFVPFRLDSISRCHSLFPRNQGTDQKLTAFTSRATLILETSMMTGE